MTLPLASATIDAVLTAMRDPDLWLLIEQEVQLPDRDMSTYTQIMASGAAIAVVAKNEISAWFDLAKLVNDSPAATAHVRLGIVATAFDHAQLEMMPNPGHTDEMGLHIVQIVERKFQRQFLEPGQPFSSLSWHRDPYIMERLTTLPLAEFETGRYADSQLPDDMEVTEYLQMLLTDSETHKVHGTMKLIERHAERLPATFTQQRDLAICLLSILLGTSSMETMDARLKAWLRGDKPDPELSLRRQGVAITTLGLLEDFGQAERRAALAQAIINYVYSEHAIGEAPTFDLESGVMHFGCPPGIDLDEEWEEYTATS